MKKLKILLIIGFVVVNACSIQLSGNENFARNNQGAVAVIINKDLYKDVQDSIDLYISDLKNEGHEEVLLFEWDYANKNVEELKALLSSYYEQVKIQGAVLIGRLPYAWGIFKLKDTEIYSEGPIDTYLMCLNSDSFIRDDKGRIIGHEGKKNPDIWVSRIWAPENPNLFLGMSEIDLIKNYFEKNHLYRTCQIPVSDLKYKYHSLGMAEHEHDTIEKILCNGYEYLLFEGYVNGYLELLNKDDSQYLFLQAHGFNTMHVFCENKDDTKHQLHNHEIMQVPIKQPFLLLNSCNVCQYTHKESLGSVYLFGPHSSSLVIAGLSVFGNILDIQFMHSNGKNFGNNILSYFNVFNLPPLDSYFPGYNGQILSDESRSTDSGDLNLGFTLLGDPTLKAYVDMKECLPYNTTAKDLYEAYRKKVLQKLQQSVKNQNKAANNPDSESNKQKEEMPQPEKVTPKTEEKPAAKKDSPKKDTKATKVKAKNKVRPKKKSKSKKESKPKKGLKKVNKKDKKKNKKKIS